MSDAVCGDFLVGGSYNCVGTSFKVAGTATMPMFKNLGSGQIHYDSTLVLATWRHGTTVTQDGTLGVRKCLNFP